MSWVEHGQVQDDATEHSALAGSEEHTADDQAGEVADEAHAGSYDAPRHREDGKVASTSDDFQKPVGGHIEENVEDVEDGEGDVVAIARQVEVGDEAVEFGVALEGCAC